MSDIYIDKMMESLDRTMELAANPDKWDYRGVEAYLADEAISALVKGTANYLKELGTKPENYTQAAQNWLNRASDFAQKMDPSSVIDQHRLATMERLSTMTRDMSTFYSTQQSSTASLHKTAALLGNVVGGIVALADIFEASATGGTAEGLRTTAGALAGILGGQIGFSLASSVAIGLGVATGGAVLAGVAAGVIAGYLISKGVEAAWDTFVDNDALNNFFAELTGSVADAVGEFFQDALNWVPRKDPLILDLDGDGIETTPADGSVLFDHDGDGIKNASGWIKSDDGILVLDRNGNGVVDNGSELFGDNTVKANGDKAKDGFDALTDMDSNGDGVVDASDAQFGNLRVWRDLNQDGESQVNELFKLSDLGITAIGTSHKEGTINVGNGNQSIAQGQFTKSDGTTGETGAAESLNLSSNNFYREFTDTIAIPEALQGLPDMAGSGAVRDLVEAAALNSDLAEVLTEYANASTREAQLGLLDKLIDVWADSADFDDWLERIADAKMGIRDVEFRISNPESTNTLPVWAVDYQESSGGANDKPNYLNTVSGYDLKVGDYPKDPSLEALAKLRVLEVFNGENFFNFGFEENKEKKLSEVRYSTGNTGRVYSIGVAIGPIIITQGALGLSAQQIGFINESYYLLSSSIYQSLSTQTRLRKYMEKIELDIDSDGRIALSFDGVEEYLKESFLVDPVETCYDLSELLHFKGSELIGDGWNSSAHLLSSMLQDLAASSESDVVTKLINHLNRFNGGLLIAESTVGGRVDGTAKREIMIGLEGKDILSGGSGADYIFGGAGNDHLQGGHGNDVLDGGAGNDTLDGGNGSDRFLFGYGAGRDVLNQNDTYRETEYTDTLVFGEGVSLDKLSLTKEGDHLVISLLGSEDQIRLSNWFRSVIYQLDRFEFADGASMSRAEFMAEFVVSGHGSDGSDNLTGYDGKDVMFGGAGDDTLMGNGGDDRLEGGAGNDKLDGGNENDQLFGGEGDDKLQGGSGSDVLDGGAGNDTLDGGNGSDRFLFGYGAGRDVLNQNDTNQESRYTDTLVFGEGVSLDKLSLTKEGDHLVISLLGSEDQIRLSNWFRSVIYQLDRFEFADGVSMSRAEFMAKLVVSSHGSDGNDILTGYDGKDVMLGGGGDDTLMGNGGDDRLEGGAGNDKLDGGNENDQLFGGEGDDRLQGGHGNDVLDGGAGNDTLDGGNGSDRFLFGYGAGRDVLNQNDTNQESRYTDTLVFGEGVSLDKLSLTKEGDHLIISLLDSEDQIRLTNWFRSVIYQLDRFEFADGVSMSRAEFMAKLVVSSHGSEGNDSLTGYDGKDVMLGGGGDDTLKGNGGDDRLEGGAGNDTLDGGNQNDQLFGGEGNDKLQGGSGNDVLDGGAGNDTLDGGNGSDRFLFGYGAGRDVLNQNDTYRESEYTDTLVFGEGVSLDKLSLTKEGDHLIISLLDSEDQIRLTNWFRSVIYQLDRFEFADGASMSRAEFIKATTIRTPIAGTSEADVLTGTEAHEYIAAGDGADTLTGGKGKDLLEGGNGSDTYLFNAGDGQDLIYEAVADIADVDQLVFGEGIGAEGLWFTRTENHLDVSLLGSNDSVRIDSWFEREDSGIEEIHTQDAMLDHSKVEALVNAMAAFGAPTGGEITLTDEERSQVNAAIAAAW